MSELDASHLKTPETEAQADESGTTLGVVDNLIGFHLRLAQDAVFQAFVRELADVPGMRNIAPGHSTLITLISQNPGITQTALSKAAARDKSTLTPILNDFVKRGFVSRKRLATDKRSFALNLTPKGQKFCAELQVYVQRIDRKLAAIVGEHNREAFIAILKAIKRECEDR
jgi:DNA-binding MarR family transcriptional regulator